eukprot:TRINITY_DN10456_c0_g1_i1.p2 TRINITY_DN10456_c0_g1~~TRINITY_DN10456_c0_g1_i1.p2  ORF type:complete len:145 (-),score=11.48 TRINITY_DN10456_c0_g1_i1:215-649(-)
MWACDVLTEIALLSRDHDAFAVLQMPPEGTPGLKDVVQTMMDAYALLDYYLLKRQPYQPESRIARYQQRILVQCHLRSKAGHAGDFGSDPSAEAVHACLCQCLHRMKKEFGPVLGHLHKQGAADPRDRTDIPSLDQLAGRLTSG